MTNGLRRLASALRRLPLGGKGSGPRFTVEHSKYGAFEVGTGTYGEPVVVYWDCGATLRIGRYCSIAAGVTVLLGGEHHTDWVTTYPFSLMFPDAAELQGYPHTKGDVNIGSDVWLGYDALILSGVTIGHGAVVGARSVVARDVEPYAVVAGNPARVIRHRFTPPVVERLLAARWWDWPEAKIREAWPLLMSNRIEDFLEKYA
jgi:acetyltransferase-like isoleucine patch superfamily enzyme